MYNTHHIKVLQHHIDNGQPRQPKSCPIALAMKEAGYGSVAVDSTISFVEDGKLYYSETPTEAFDFMEAFDEQESVAPFEFDIDFLMEITV